MSWPTSTQFGRGRDAVRCGRKGGLALRRDWKRKHTVEYRRGYGAGFATGRRLARRRQKGTAA